MGRKAKYSKDIKIKACKDYKAGKGSFLSIAKSIGTAKTVVRQWFLTYEIHGEIAFDSSSSNSSYTKEFKQSVASSYISGNYSLYDLSAKYNISHEVIRQWVNKIYNGIELKNYNPKGEIYTMKSRNTTFEERVEIVEWVIANDMSYKDAANKYGIKYALVYQWVHKYLKNGVDALKHKKRGPKPNRLKENPLNDIDKLKIELEREKALRKQAEFRLEVLKKKEEFEQNLHFPK